MHTLARLDAVALCLLCFALLCLLAFWLLACLLACLLAGWLACLHACRVEGVEWDGIETSSLGNFQVTWKLTYNQQPAKQPSDSQVGGWDGNFFPWKLPS